MFKKLSLPLCMLACLAFGASQLSMAVELSEKRYCCASTYGGGYFSDSVYWGPNRAVTCLYDNGASYSCWP